MRNWFAAAPGDIKSWATRATRATNAQKPQKTAIFEAAMLLPMHGQQWATRATSLFNDLAAPKIPVGGDA
jgi:hypothetical protein